jgi:hypothetical protein
MQIIMLQVLGICEHDQIDNIQCRPLKSTKGVKNHSEKFDCDLNKGLVCNDKCNDIEIRVHCKCNKDISNFLCL